MVVASVTVHDVEIVDFVEVMLGGVGGVDACHARVKAAAEDGGESGFLEAFFESPLPGVLKVSLVLGFIVCRVQIGAAALETCLHDGQVLIGQREVHDEVGLEVPEKFAELFHAVGINLCGADVGASDGFDNGIAL